MRGRRGCAPTTTYATGTPGIYQNGHIVPFPTGAPPVVIPEPSTLLLLLLGLPLLWLARRRVKSS